MADDLESKIKEELHDFNELVFDHAEEKGIEALFLYTGKGEKCVFFHNLEKSELVELVIHLCALEKEVARELFQFLLLNVAFREKSDKEKRKMN